MCKNAIAGSVRRPMDREIRLEPTPRAPREARAFVSHHFREMGFPKLIDDGKLIVSELVTNSIEAVPHSPLWVGLRPAGQFLILEDWDCSPDPSVRKEPDHTAEGGRGLHIVQELSITWGCDTFCCGKVTWAMLG
jgi:hypothetical protein